MHSHYYSQYKFCLMQTIKTIFIFCASSTLKIQPIFVARTLGEAGDVEDYL
jgi:hypothetical protein